MKGVLHGSYSPHMPETDEPIMFDPCYCALGHDHYSDGEPYWT